MVTYPHHLLQSSEWAEFREKWGTKVVRVGKAHFTIHPIPFKGWAIGYMPRAYPQDIDWELFSKKAKEEHCIYVKFEPNSEAFDPPKGLDVKPGERMFAYATYLINLSKTENELMAAMHHKTRYNIRVAQRKGVEIKLDHDKKMVEEFLDLFHETAVRHNVTVHPDSYYRSIFEVFRQKEKAEIITGYFEGKALASMMLIVHDNTLFYPYGGSTHLHKDKMAFSLVFWEAIKFGKAKNCHYFDLWNCLPPEQENPNHPWYGFHRFKKGFGGELIRFPGAYDIVFEPLLYPIVIYLNKIRWIFLNCKASLRRFLKR